MHVERRVPDPRELLLDQLLAFDGSMVSREQQLRLELGDDVARGGADQASR